MSKHDEGRRAFLVGAGRRRRREHRAGSGSARQKQSPAPRGDAMRRQRTTPPMPMHDDERRPRRVLQRRRSRTITAFAERLMPGAPGKPGATDAGVLNYIDLALAGAYADQQDFYRRGLTQLDAHCTQAYGKPFRRLTAAQQDEIITRAGAGQGAGLRLADRAGVLQHAAHPHHGRHVRRPDLRRQQGLRRLAAGRFPRRAAACSRRRTCKAQQAFTREPIIGLQARAKSREG